MSGRGLMSLALARCAGTWRGFSWTAALVFRVRSASFALAAVSARPADPRAGTAERAARRKQGLSSRLNLRGSASSQSGSGQALLREPSTVKHLKPAVCSMYLVPK